MQSSEFQLFISAASQALSGIEFLTVTIVFDISNQHDVPLLMVLILHEQWIITHRYPFPFRMYHSFFTLCPKIKPYLPTKFPTAHISKCQNSASCDWWHKKLSDGAVICADNGKQQFQGN